MLKILEKSKLTDLVDVTYLKRLQDTIAEAAQVTIGLVHPDGSAMVASDTLGNFCGCAHHIEQKVQECCEHMAIMLKHSRQTGEPFINPCIKTGLTTISVPIMIRGDFYGCWIIGQIRIRTDISDNVQAAARKLSISTEEVTGLIENNAEISLLSFRRTLNLLRTVTDTLVQLALSNLERRQREREVRGITDQMDAANRMLKKFIDATDIAMYISDLYTGEVLMVNETFSKLAGKPREELVGEKCWDVCARPYNNFCPSCPRMSLLDSEGKPTGHISWVFHDEKQGKWLRITNQAIMWSKGQMANLVTQLDVTAEQTMKLELERIAFYDRQTGLPNREKLNADFSNEYRYIIHNSLMAPLLADVLGSNSPGTASTKTIDFVCLDISGLRQFIDTYGRETGAVLMQAIVDWCRTHDFGESVLYRIDSYEFCLAIYHQTEAFVEFTAGVLMQRFDTPWIINVNNQELSFLCQANVSVVFGNQVNIAENDILTLLSRSLDISRKRRRLFIYDEIADLESRETIRFEQHLKSCVFNGMRGFSLNFQPIVEMASGTWKGLEALCRWNIPELGHVSPLRFIEEAERHGLINLLGNWVLKTAIETSKKLELDKIEDYFISVNISPLQMMDESFGDYVLSLLERYNYPGHKLSLEITESMEMSFNSFTMELIDKLRAEGIRLALDDFGTGYSSFNSLKNMPVSYVKTERQFVQGIEEDPHMQYFIYIMTEIAHANNMKLIAEGIETREQLEIIKNNGADFIQGYYFSQPLTLPELQEKISEFTEFNPAVLTYSAEEMNINQWLNSQQAYMVTPSLFKVFNQCMQALFSEQSIKEEVEAVLQIVGTQFNVRRAFAFIKDPEDDTSGKWRYRWSCEGGPNLPYFDTHELVEFLRLAEPLFREKGMLLATTIETLPPEIYEIKKNRGFRSLAVMPIWEDDELIGFIGFNDSNPREWTPEEAVLLWNLSLLMSSSIKREKLRQEADSKTLILKEILNTSIYNVVVSDRESDEILWMNDRMKEKFHFDDKVIGQKCYEVVAGNTERCRFCPVRELVANPEATTQTLEFYSEKLNRSLMIFSNLILWEGNRPAHVEYSVDITDFKRTSDRLEYFATTDVLTGALNRSTVVSRLTDIFSRAHRHNTLVTMAYANIVGIREINAEHGHFIGNKVLQLAAEAIRSSIRNDDVFGRIGSDEFIIIFPDCTPAVASRRMREAQRVLSIMTPPAEGVSMSFAFSVVDNKAYPYEKRENYIDRLFYAAERKMRNAKKRRPVTRVVKRKVPASRALPESIAEAEL